MEHLDPVRRKVREATISEPPKPWRLVGGSGIGGLTHVGFADDSELLLVLSSQGRGIFDCETGQRIARDRDMEHENQWYGRDSLIAHGFGPLEGQQIRLAGIHGGGLPRIASGGWHVEELAIDWPEVSLLLLGPYQSIYQQDGAFTKLDVQSELRAFGFSYTGRSLVYAISSDLVIFHRASD